MQRQFEFEHKFSNIVGGLFEINLDNTVKYDFFKLTRRGKSIFKKNKELSEEADCIKTSLMVQSVKDEVKVRSNYNSDVHITDARSDSLLEFRKLSTEEELKVKCPYCSKYFIPTSILAHLNRSKTCQPKISVKVKDQLKIVSHAYSSRRHMSKVEYDAKRYQENHSEILGQRRQQYQKDKSKIL